MAHLFEQMYVDEVDFEETLTPQRLIDLVFTEFVYRQIQQLNKLKSCAKTDEIDGNQWTTVREHYEISDEGERWLTYADQAVSMVNREIFGEGL